MRSAQARSQRPRLHPWRRSNSNFAGMMRIAMANSKSSDLETRLAKLESENRELRDQLKRVMPPEPKVEPRIRHVVGAGGPTLADGTRVVPPVTDIAACTSGGSFSFGS